MLEHFELAYLEASATLVILASALLAATTGSAIERGRERHERDRDHGGQPARSEKHDDDAEQRLSLIHI